MAVSVLNPSAPATKKERLDVYCENLCNGIGKVKAYIAAGYSPLHAERNVTSYHKSNNEYIQSYISEHIGTHAPSALKVVLQIMNDESEKGGIRLKAAQDVLDRAGFSAKQKFEVTTKEVHDMSTEDLHNEIQRILSEEPNLAKVFKLPNA
jgi:phage terminase small subunit